MDSFASWSNKKKEEEEQAKIKERESLASKPSFSDWSNKRSGVTVETQKDTTSKKTKKDKKITTTFDESNLEDSLIEQKKYDTKTKSKADKLESRWETDKEKNKKWTSEVTKNLKQAKKLYEDAQNNTAAPEYPEYYTTGRVYESRDDKDARVRQRYLDNKRLRELNAVLDGTKSDEQAELDMYIKLYNSPEMDDKDKWLRQLDVSPEMKERIKQGAESYDEAAQIAEYNDALGEQITLKNKIAKEDREQKKLKDYIKKINPYYDLVYNPDFEQRSGFENPTKTGYGDSLLTKVPGFETVGYDWPLYDAINGDPDAYAALATERIMATSDPYTGVPSQDEQYDIKATQSLTEEEKKIFNYLANTKGRAAAEEYFNLLQDELYKRVAIEEQLGWQYLTRSSNGIEKVALTAFAILAGPARVKEYVLQALHMGMTGEVDQYAPYNQATRFRSTVFETVPEKWGKYGKLGYSLGVSFLDFLYNAAIGSSIGSASVLPGLPAEQAANAAGKISEAVVLSMMGSEAAADTVVEKKAAGYDDKRAFWLGTAAGIAETVSEKIGFDELLNTRAQWRAGGRNFFKFVARQGGAEGLEEGVADVFNWTADALYDAFSQQNDSEWRRAVERVMADNPGMSADTAFGKVMGDYLGQLLLDMGGGAISGVAMGGGNVALMAIQDFLNTPTKGQYGKAIVATGETANLIDKALSFEGSNAAKLAEKIKETIAASKTPSNREIGKLFTEYQKNLSEQERSADVTALIETGLRYPGSEYYEKANSLNNRINEGLKVSDITDDEIVDLYEASRNLSDEINSGQRAVYKPEQQSYNRQAMALNDQLAKMQSQDAMDDSFAQRTAEQLRQNLPQVKDMGLKLPTVNSPFELKNLADIRDNKAPSHLDIETNENVEPSEALRGIVNTEADTTLAQEENAAEANAEAESVAESKKLQLPTVKENNNGGERTVRVRHGGQRNDSQNTGKPVQEVAANTRSNEARKISSAARDSEANRLVVAKSAESAQNFTSAADKNAKVFRVVKGDTRFTKEAKRIAKAFGLQLDLFAGDNLQLSEEYDGGSARGVLEGNRIAVRVDHPDFTADQLTWHEVGHHLINTGAINRNDVLNKIIDSDIDWRGVVKTYGQKYLEIEDMDERVAAAYADAYNGTDLLDRNVDGLLDEIVCDGIGKMNIFDSNITGVAEEVRKAADEIIEKVQKETEQQRNRAPPQKASSTKINTSVEKAITTFNKLIKETPVKSNFSLDAPVEATPKLLAIHNIRAKDLLKVLQLGRFAGISVAIVRAAEGHSNFGEFSFVFYKEAIDPQLDSRNEIFQQDAWTPTMTDLSGWVEYEYNEEAYNSFWNEIYKLARKTGDGRYANKDAIPALPNDPRYSLEDIVWMATVRPENARARAMLQAAYLADKGISIDPDKLSKSDDEDLSDIVGRRDLINWTDQRMNHAGVITNAGFITKASEADVNRERPFNETHAPYNAESIAKKLAELPHRGYGVPHNIHGIASVTGRQFSSIDEVKAYADRLAVLPEDEYEEIASGLNDELRTWEENAMDTLEMEFTGRYDQKIYDSPDADYLKFVVMSAARMGYTTAKEVQQHFKARKVFGMKNSQAKELLKIYKAAAEMPTGYFEAKLFRTLPLFSSAYALAPDNAPSDIIRLLTQSFGVEVYYYKAGDEDDRLRVLNKQAKRHRAYLSSEARAYSPENAVESYKKLVEETPVKPRFSLDSVVEATPHLLAIHNGEGDDFLRMYRMGGQPGYSYAIVRAAQGHLDFGRWSMIGGREVIDPVNPLNEAVKGDSYSPTVSTIIRDIEFQHDNAKIAQINKELKELSDKIADGKFSITDTPVKPKSMQNEDGLIADLAYGFSPVNIMMKAAYLADKGISIANSKNAELKLRTLARSIDVDEWLQTKIKDTVIKSGIRKPSSEINWARDNSFEDIHDEYNSENIAKALNRKQHRGLDAPFDAVGLISVAAKQFKTINEIKGDAGYLNSTLSDDDWERLCRPIDKALEWYSEALQDDLTDDSGDNVDEGMLYDLIINEETAKCTTPEQIIDLFEDAGVHGMDEDYAKDLMDLYERAAELPSRFFEVKVYRNVTSKEKQAVLYPPEASKETVEELQNYVECFPYDGTDEDRIRVANEVAEHLDLYLSREANTDKFKRSERIRKEIADLRRQATVAKKSAAHWKGETKLTTRRSYKESDVNALVGQFNKYYDTHFTKAETQEIKKSIMDLGDYVLNFNGANVYENAKSVADDIARKVVQNATTTNDMDDMDAALVSDPASFEEAEAVDDIADSILSDILHLGEKQTFADKKKAEIDRLRAQKNARYEALQEHYREQKLADREARQRRKVEDYLLRIARRLSKKKLPLTMKNELNSIIGNVDLIAKGILGRTINKLSDLQTWYEEQKSFLGDNFTPVEHIEEQLKRLSNKKISELDTEDLLSLVEVLRHFENNVLEAERFRNSKIKNDIFEAGIKTITNVEAAVPGRIRKSLDAYSAVNRMANYDKNSPLVIAERECRAGSQANEMYKREALKIVKKWATDRKFMKSIAGKKARDCTITGTAVNGTIVSRLPENPERGTYLLPTDTPNVYEINEYTKDKTWVKKGTVTAEATTQKLTPAMLIELYLAQKNDDNMRHYRYGGATFPNMEAYRKGDMETAYSLTNTVKLQRTDILNAAKQLTTEEKAFADAIWKYFNEFAPERLNKASLELDGFERFLVENYYPIFADPDFLGKNYEALGLTINAEGDVSAVSSASLANPGFSKERTHASNPIMVRDANSTLMQSIRMNGKYATMAVPLQNLSKLLNMKVAGKDMSVRKSLKHQFKTSGWNYLNDYMKDYAGVATRTRSENAAEKWTKKLRGKYARGVLTLGMGTAIKQAASYPAASVVLGSKALIKALDPVRKADVSFIDEMTAAYTMRTEGYSSPELAELALEGKDIPKLLNWIQGVDMLTTKTLKRAAYFAVKEKTNLEVGTPEFKQAVVDMYVEALEKTQPNYTAALRPGILRSESEFMRTVTMFMTQPLQNYNILYDAFGNYRAKARAYKNTGTAEARSELRQARKTFVSATTSQFVSALLFALMQAGWDRMRGKDKKYRDKEGKLTLGSVGKGLGLTMASSGAGMFVGGKFALEVSESLADTLLKATKNEAIFDASFYGLESIEMGAINDATSAAMNIIKSVADVANKASNDEDIDWESVARKMLASAGNLGTMFGVPLGNAVTDLQAVGRTAIKGLGKVNAVDDVTSDYIAMRIVNSTQKDYYQTLFEYYKNDREKFTKLYNLMVKDKLFDPDKIASAMEKLMRDDEGVSSSKDLSQRFLTPDVQQDYDKVMKAAEKSSLWKKSSGVVKNDVKNFAYDYIAGEETKLDKINDHPDTNLSYKDYINVLLNLDAADKAPLHTYKQEEISAALENISGLSQTEKYWVWQTISDADSDANNPYREEGSEVRHTKTEAKEQEAAEEAKQNKRDKVEEIDVEDSELIKHISYSEKTSTLTIKMVGSGKTYTYYNVPKSTWTGLKNAKSKGQYYNANISGNENYKKKS